MTQEQFIKDIAKYVQKYATQYNILCPSAIISQAILESASGTSELAVNAHNYFGLKYRANRCPSACGIYYKVGSEQDPVTGKYTSSAMQWMKFSCMEDGVKGYFDFINIANYNNLKGVDNPETYLKNIKADGYATSINYVDNLLAVIKKYNLTQYDIFSKDNKDTVIKNTNSPLVTYTKISPNKTSPRNHAIDTITIHCIVGQWTAKQGCDYFAATNRQCSANYVVGKDGSIGLSVDEKDRSWCSSNTANDHRAITIEVASDTKDPYAVTNQAYNALIELVADICKRNGINKLVWSTSKADRINRKNGCNMTVHRDFANKSCPGQYLYSRHGHIAEEVNKRLNNNTSTSTTPSTTIIKPTVKVNTTLNIRNKPNGTIVGKLTNGANVSVLDYQNNWLKIGESRWVSADYISTSQGKVTTSSLNIRSGAGATFSDIGDLKNNEVVSIFDEKNGWYKVLSSSKQFGWVSSEYINLI